MMHVYPLNDEHEHELEGTMCPCNPKVEFAALRARVAELETTIAELTTDGNAATLAANLAKASKRNAELVALIGTYQQGFRLIRILAETPVIRADALGEVNVSGRMMSGKILAVVEDCLAGRTPAPPAHAESATSAKEAPTYFVPPEQLLPAYRGDMPAKHPDTDVVTKKP